MAPPRSGRPISAPLGSGEHAAWLQLAVPGRDAPSPEAAGVVYRVGERWHPMPTERARPDQLLGLALGSPNHLEDAIAYALDRDFDLLVLDGTGAIGEPWPELAGAPNLAIVRDTIAILRRIRKEEMIDIAYFGGARSGTDAAKLVGLGANVIGYGVPVALAVGGEITPEGMRFAPDRSDEERHRRDRQYPQGQRRRGLDDGPLHRQDPPAQHRARRSPLSDPSHRRCHRHPASRDPRRMIFFVNSTRYILYLTLRAH